MSKVTRRNFLLTAGAATAGTLILHGCSSGNSSSSSPAASSSPLSAADTPETTKATLGFIALTDCAPLVIAKEKGYFEKYGMKDVSVTKQTSWAVTRDNLELGGNSGGIDGAHILSPMPYLMTLGTITKGKKPLPMNILARLNTNGQGISVSKTYNDLKLGTDSSKLLEKIKSGTKIKGAVTFPGGTHDLWMRYWLAAGGIDPNKDVELVVIPPPQMVANMKTGTMDVFCVGEPWNGQLVNQELGYTAVTTGELWKDHPEKSLAMRADWVEKNPKAAKALLMGVMEAQQWCDKEENKEEMCKILSGREWVKAPAKDIVERSKGNIDFGNGRKEENSPLLMKFWRDNASFPFKSHDTWFLTEDKRWGYIPADTDIKGLVDKVNRSDIWREAAKTLNVTASEIPEKDSRGVETFFDGVKFDSEKPEDYLKSLKIKKA